MGRSHQRHIALPPTAGPSRGSSLPEDVLRGAVARLKLVTGVVAFVAFLRVVVSVVSPERFGGDSEVMARGVVFGAIGLASSCTFALLFTRFRPARLLGFGQVYFVIVMALTVAAESASPWGDAPFARGVPLACVFMLVFPVIVPMAPRRFVVVSLLAIAVQPPIMLLVPRLVGFEPPSAELLAMANLPVVVCAAVAYLVAKTIYGLGKELGQALQAGSYQLVAPLGKGGMGEVWRARHGMLSRQAAIKLIRHDNVGDDPRALAHAQRRFEAEADAVASLRSQHTIQLYDYGVTDDGALYYAMELLDGLDLDRLVERHGPMPPERVVHVLLQACHSLGEAHAAGLVHRDIKPANIFLARLGRDVDVVKVLDFGLATRPVTERLADAKTSMDGNIVGTPAYMAPEQVLGDPTIDGRADLYALGLVAWWLLTGRDAFRATSASQAMFAHVNVDADAPSEFARTPLPTALDTIVLRCLAKRREDRFQDADELARALTAVELDTPWTRERALAWWREHLPERQAEIASESPAEPGLSTAETRAA